MVDDDHQELVPTLVPDLIDPDAPKPVEAIMLGLDVSPDAGSVHVGDVFEWRSVDLTPYVLEQLSSSDAVSLVVREDIPDGDNGLATRIRSRENTGYEPYLLLRVE